MRSSLRPVRYVLATSAAVFVACAVVFSLQLLDFQSTRARLAGLTASATGVVARVDDSDDSDDNTVTVRFPVPDQPEATAAIELDTTPPPLGTRVPVRYDPAAPTRAITGGATSLVTADRAATYATVTVVAVLAMLAVNGFLFFTRFVQPSRRRSGPSVAMRRVKVQRGLLTRSWLETETATPRWIPVYFSPTLISLPSPTPVEVLGDVRTNRHVAVRINGEVLYPAGAVRTSEPRGRRTDNPSLPDDDRSLAAVRPVSLGRQFRADLPVLAVAPVVGAFWAFVDGSGFTGWLTVTVLIAAFGFWWAALRGSDPS
ncbi:DUF3592 domain-containing protein [Amycolatopsis jejuensis]|uniref:DUF3592 domain-containing protein n=1 Tax=Amycolatopsis jejuensis TaxID=330084 RepID=UPI0005265B09|nr:DUF3592 domain-containing protein [Amycolatopsis jejuensis]